MSDLSYMTERRISFCKFIEWAQRLPLPDCDLLNTVVSRRLEKDIPPVPTSESTVFSYDICLGMINDVEAPEFKMFLYFAEFLKSMEGRRIELVELHRARDKYGDPDMQASCLRIKLSDETTDSP